MQVDVERPLLVQRERELTCNPHQGTSNVGVRTYSHWAIVVVEWIQTINRGERASIDAALRSRKIIDHVPVHSHGKDVLMRRCFSWILGPAVKRRHRVVADPARFQIRHFEMWERG